MANVPAWSAARSGLLGDTGAVDASAGINQFLGTHPMTVVYQGNSVLTPNGSGGTAWAYQLSTMDLAQPFTMSGTSIGRVVLPLLPVGAGADLIVSLCSNSSGNAGTVITQTRIPASWITLLAAVSSVSVPSSSTPITQYTGNPLATAAFNSFHMGTPTTRNWSFPTIASGLNQINGAQTYSGNYFIAVGGFNGSTYYPNVFTIEYDAQGNLSQAVPQPSMPQPNNGGCAVAAVTDPSSGAQTVVVAGGSTAPSTYVNTVYTAGFDPATGAISSWTTQQSLPQALRDPGVATYNGFVYLVGGINGTNTADLNTVYYAQVSNGQITTWNSGPPYPLAIDSMYAVVINGFLVVFGGENFSGTYTTACYYAPINADGSLGNWQAGPSLPAGIFQFQVGTPVFGTYGVMGLGNSSAYVLGFTENGPDTSWQSFSLPNGGVYLAEASVDAGDWQSYGLFYNYYTTSTLTLTPRISVPLPASGLTNGATYHILLQQVGSDLNNFLRTHDDLDVYSGNPTVLTRSKGSTTWTAGTSGHAVPVQVYDQTASGQPWHIWSDSGAWINTFVYATTPDRRPIGLLDATAQPGPVLNANWTFTAGTSPWGGNNGTLVRSNSFTHGELPFSAKLTPNGVSTQAYIESELVTIALQQPYTANCWFYSPTGYSNCEILINWYSAAGFSGGFISSVTGATTSVAAGVWTQLTVTGTPPTNAVYATIGVYERGTPPATAIFYASAVTLQNTIGPQVSTVTQCNWSAWWPAQLGPPTGVTVLA